MEEEVEAPLGARSTVVPCIWALNLFHSAFFHHRMSGAMWWTCTMVPMNQANPTNGSSTVRTSSQTTPATESPDATPIMVNSASIPAMNAVTIHRSRRIAFTQRAGFPPTIIFFHHTWWM